MRVKGQNYRCEKEAGTEIWLFLRGTAAGVKVAATGQLLTSHLLQGTPL